MNKPKFVLTNACATLLQETHDLACKANKEATPPLPEPSLDECAALAIETLKKLYTGEMIVGTPDDLQGLVAHQLQTMFTAQANRFFDEFSAAIKAGKQVEDLALGIGSGGYLMLMSRKDAEAQKSELQKGVH